MTNNKTFEQENNELFQFLLNKRFFNFFNSALDHSECVELIITPECNLKCEYCYLNKHKDKLYPKEIRDNKDIINNLKALLNYFTEKNITPKKFELYSGEIWGTDFSETIFQIIYDYCKLEQSKISFITIPTNCDFIRFEEKANRMQEWIYKFKEINVFLNISISIDGYIVDKQVRPPKNEAEERTMENFYDKIFSFAVKNGYGFHPMVSALDIDLWIENFNWWIEMFKKYDLSIDRIMMLEVRDNNWSNEKIEQYLQFLNYLINFNIEMVYNNNLLAFSNDIFRLPIDPLFTRNYNIISLDGANDNISCGIGHNLVIRLGDLTIVPCHRLSYDNFNYGTFILSEDKQKIINIKSKNLILAMKILTSSTFTYPKCDSCKYSDLCLKGCFGAQYENSRELFYPCDTVCKLFKAKIKFLKERYVKDLDLLTKLKNYYKNSPEESKRIQTLIQKLNKI